MALIARILEKNLRNSSVLQPRLMSSSTKEAADGSFDEEEFRVLNLRSSTVQQNNKKRFVRKHETLPARTQKMAIDQDWTAVWPGPRSFHPASVPLPIRQGFTVKGAAPPAKYANAELMKVPNFLHLTPPAIKQQCEAIKKFCTTWPKGLESEEKWKRHFPIEVINSDFCHALPTIRHPDARRVTLTLKLSDLKFDAHARDKFLRLVGERYNADTDVLTFMTDRCPSRKQNYDYALYLLTACYHESYVTEPWEKNKREADMEYYHYERNKSKESTEAILNWAKDSTETKMQASEGFIKSIEQLINDGENEYNLSKYKEEAKKMLGVGQKQTA